MKCPSLFDAVKPYLEKGMVVLDVGANDLSDTKKFLELGCKVIALDIDFTDVLQGCDGLEMLKKNFLDFVPSEKVDVLFVSYTAQFFPKSVFFELLQKYYSDCRVIAIRTFYKAPEPPPVGNIDISYYTESDVSQFPKGFDSYEARSWVDVHESMKGDLKTWHEIDLIAVKEPLKGLKKNGHRFGGGCLTLMFWPFLYRQQTVFGARFGYFASVKTSIFLAEFKGWQSNELREHAKASIDYYLHTASINGGISRAGSELDQSVGIEEFSLDQDPSKDPKYLRISYDRTRTNSQAVLAELNKVGLMVDLVQGPVDL